MRTLLISVAVMLTGCATGNAVRTEPAPADTGQADAPPPTEDDADAKRVAELINTALANQRISINLEDAEFATALMSISLQSDVKIVIDPAVLTRLTNEDVRVNLQVDEIPIRSALNILLDFTGLTSKVKHGVLYITDPSRDSSEEADSASDSQAAKVIEAKLDNTQVSLNFNSTTLKAVMGFFRDVTGVNILISPRVFDLTPEKALRVTLDVEDVSMRDALSLVLEMTNLTYRIQDGVLIVTPIERK